MGSFFYYLSLERDHMHRRRCRLYLPPEWAPQSGSLLTWPHQYGDWAATLAAIEACYINLTRQICRFEPVLICCYDQDHRQHIDRQLRNAGLDPARYRLAIARSNDSWARDHGPLTVLCQQDITLLDFTFNGWGGKFNAELDNAITRTLHGEHQFADVVLEPQRMVLEGGSIEVDGCGTLLSTSRCLLSPQRNPAMSQEQIESRLSDWFGLTRILWLQHGKLEGDDTDSHIDILARFCDGDTIVYTHCDDNNDSHFADLKAMEAELQSFRTVTDAPYTLKPLPWPQAKFDNQGNRLAASYANFLVINDAVLVPAYNDPADDRAAAVIQGCFTNREVIKVDASALIQQGGSLHCAAMQLPQGVLP